MSKYPIPFAHDRFARVPDFVPPRPPEEPPEEERNRVSYRGVLRKPTPPRAVAKAVWIEQKDKPTYRSASFQNVAPDENQDPAAKHFHFLPGVDGMQVKWEVENAHLVTKARIELWAATDANGAVWVQEKTEGDAVSLLQGEGEQGGSLDVAAISIDDGERFKGKVPNLANAPYQVRLVVTDKNGAESVAWTYFDVLVHKIVLEWGGEDLIPDGEIEETKDTFKDVVAANEKYTLKRLRNEHKGQPAVTSIKPTGSWPVVLPGSLAAYVTYYEWACWRDMAFQRHRWLWGRGPRLPIVARIFLKNAAGEAVHSAEAAKALGKAQLLWDWEDKPLDARRQSAPHGTAGQFVAAALNYKVVDDGNDPPGCLNVHVERGGKRGSKAAKDRIFPAQDGGDFPFVVEPCESRKWAALSTAHEEGERACCTGVIFQPSRMALDSYKLTVAPVVARTPEGKPALDAAPDKRASERLRDLPGLPVAQTATFEVKRLIKARYLRKDDATPAMDLTKIDQMYAPAGFLFDWLNDDPDANFSGFWDKDEYNRLIDESITFADYETSEDADVLGKRHKYETDKRKNPIHALANLGDANAGRQGEVTKWDHWYGVPRGAPVQPGQKACQEVMAFPDLRVIMRAILREETKNYIDKRRWRNDKKSAWNKFKAKNAGAQEPELLERFFYEELNVTSQNKVLAAVDPRVTQAGWPTVLNNPKLDDALSFANEKFGGGFMALMSELHHRKVMQDAFFGVTFFHYTAAYRVVDRRGGGVQDHSLGGVAKADMSSDLGLKSCFFVWDHPTSGRRAIASGTEQMDGNMTACHEFGHSMHLPHANPTATTEKERRAHDPNDRECIMNYNVADRHLCGVCILRLRGWAYFKDDWSDDTGEHAVLGFSRSDPTAEGAAPTTPETDFYISKMERQYPELKRN
ncbi:MAG: hypothetical protein M9894_22240 [Planctomycetes bacterium]|nr:hypothetical protein [Planctomycetota bacterium]